MASRIFFVVWTAVITWSNVFLGDGSRSMMHESGLSGFCAQLLHGCISKPPKEAINSRLASLVQIIKFRFPPRSLLYGNFLTQSGLYLLRLFDKMTVSY